MAHQRCCQQGPTLSKDGRLEYARVSSGMHRTCCNQDLDLRHDGSSCFATAVIVPCISTNLSLLSRLVTAVNLVDVAGGPFDREILTSRHFSPAARSGGRALCFFFTALVAFILALASTTTLLPDRIASARVQVRSQKIAPSKQTRQPIAHTTQLLVI